MARTRQPPKSHSAAAKDQQGTSSRVMRGHSRESRETPSRSDFRASPVPQKGKSVAELISVPRTPKRLGAPSRADGLSPVELLLREARSSLGLSPKQKIQLSQAYVADSPVDHGSFAGTTMLQSDDSEAESEELDPNLILDTLLDLHHASNRVLDLLTPPGVSYASISKLFKTPKFAARFNRIKETFEAQKNCMGKASYIDVKKSVAVLPSIKQLQWKPETLYQVANLAQLALDVIGPQPNRGFLAAVNENFPHAFMNPFPSGLSQAPKPNDEMMVEIALLGLDIRTQLFIGNLPLEAADSNLEPEKTLKDVFYKPSLNDENTGLAGWSMEGLEEDDMIQFHTVIQERIDLIRQHLEVPWKLESRFPWSDFVAKLANWIRERVNDLDQQLGSQVSIEEAIKILQNELEKRSSVDQDLTLDSTSPTLLEEVEPPVEKNPTPERTVDLSKGGKEAEPPASPSLHPRRRLKAKGAYRLLLGKPVTAASPTANRHLITHHNQHKGLLLPLVDSDISSLVHAEKSIPASQQNVHPVVAPAVPTQVPPESSQAIDESIMKLPPLSSAQLWKLSQEGKRVARSTAQNRPRGAFIDRQNDAHRVSPISFPPCLSSDQIILPKSRKRAAAKAFLQPEKSTHDEGDYNPENEEDVNVSEDGVDSVGNEDSEEDEEFETDIRPHKQRRVAEAPPRPATRYNRAPRTLAPLRPATAAPPEQRFEQVNVEAPSTTNWVPRRSWSLEEEKCLRELIEKCGGPCWSEIKRLDGMSGDILFRRTQVQIKDKGGQMHYDDLMNGRPISEAMANIPIKGKMRDRLMREGKLDA